MHLLIRITPSVVAAMLLVLALAGQSQGRSSEAVACSSQLPSTVLGKPGSLTGTWRGSSGGTYWIRQAGNCVWWYGESAGGGDFTNVFFGTISSSGPTSTIVGVWADVPKGRSENLGSLILGVTSTSSIVTKAASGGFNRAFSLKRTA
jgi:hypothetical protein